MSVCKLRSDTCGTRALSSERLSDRPERCVNTPISSAVNSAFEPYSIRPPPAPNTQTHAAHTQRSLDSLIIKVAASHWAQLPVDPFLTPVHSVTVTAPGDLTPAV